MSLAADTLRIPGTTAMVTWERDEHGRVQTLIAGGRTYLTQTGGETAVGDLLRYREAAFGHVLWRHAAAGNTTWTETYRWDDAGRIVEVDGVAVRYDERGRVVECHGQGGTWTYGYAGDHLAVIESPRGVRHLARGDDGRPLLVRDPDGTRLFSYTDDGQRIDACGPPVHWQRDAHGRLWTVTGDDGRIEHTFLWDGLRCLGRIDGPPGDPLAAAFCLDPGGTPIRVVDATGVTRVPRDAFGEALLDLSAVPGLFGGSIHGGLVHLPERALDPFVGAFTAPDPFAGLDADPRRRDGFQGELPIDDPACGPYAVAQHDPISRTDPTGGFSIWLAFLDLTWGWNNNVLAHLGLDLCVNMIVSPISELWESGNARRSFIGDGITAKSHDTWGFQRDGFVSYEDKAWTYGHTVWIGEDMKERNNRGACFVPSGPVRPTYYGSILRVAPASSRPFLLEGSLPATARLAETWSRLGGHAEPVAPGLLTPVFPSGGFHFNDREKLPHGQEASIAELFATGEIVQGRLATRYVLTVGAAGLGLAASAPVLVEDRAAPQPNRYLTTVLSADETGGRTRVVLELPSTTALGPEQVRLRSVTGPGPAETMNADAAGLFLDAVGTNQPYAAGDLLRLRQAGADVGVAIVDRLQARLELDAGIGALAGPLTVFHAVRTGVTVAATKTSDATFEVAAAGMVPDVDDMVEVSDGAAALAVIATAVAGQVVTVDRSLAPLAAAVTWQPITAVATPLGTDATLPVATELTYTAAAVRAAPQTGFARIVGDDDAAVVRTIVNRLADGLAFATALLGNAAQPFDVERFGFGSVDRDGLTAATERILALPTATPLGADALRLYQFPANAVVAGALQFDDGVMDTTSAVTTAALANSPDVGTLVQVDDGAVTVERVVTELRMLVTVSPSLAGSNLEAVLLGPNADEWIYEAEQPAAGPSLVIVVHPRTSGFRSEMPRFSVGEIVLVTQGNAMPYRVSAVEGGPDVLGSTLTLEGNPALLPSLGAPMTVQRLSAQDPNHGGSRIALDGRPPAGPNPPADQISFRVWSTDDLQLNDVFGIIVNGITTAVTVTGRVSQTVSFGTPTPFPAGTPGISVRNVAATNAFWGDVEQRGREVLLRDLPATSVPGAGLIVALPFHTRPGSVTGSGKISSGTTRVPVEPERELDQYQSLLDHELRHTRQCAYLGPLLLGATPRPLLELWLDKGDRIDPPAFSPYVEARLEIDGVYTDPVLYIDGETDVVFAEGDRVEVTSRGGEAVMITLEQETDDGSGFVIDDPWGEVAVMPEGTVYVRRQSQEGHWGYELASDVMRLFTYGGMLRFIHSWTYGLLGTLAARGVYAAYRGLFGHRQSYPATVTEDQRILHLTTEAGREALAKAERVLIHQGKRTVTKRVFRLEDEHLELESALIIDGEVEVRAYTRWDKDPWDWSKYNAARVPDPARPASIRIEGASELDLKKRDHVRIKAEHYEKITRVVAIAGDGTVDLKDPIPAHLLDRDLRIAHVRRDNPLDGLELGWQRDHTDWMKWVIDLQGTLLSRLNPEQGGFWDHVIKVYRFLSSPYTWSALPLPGWFFWDNAFKQAHPQRSCMEQDASVHSGSLYSPLGRLTGSLEYVGDLGRYVFFADGERLVPLGSGGANAARRDAPGVHVVDYLRAMPFVDPESGGSPHPLNRTESHAPAAPPLVLADEPGHALPDELFAKDPTDPPLLANGAPRSSPPRALAFIPSSGAIQRAVGNLVGFSRAGKHRITVAEGIANFDLARDAATHGAQTIYYDRDVKDVTVRVGGIEVAEMVTPQIVDLIVTQVANVEVEPAGDRRYGLRVLRPTTGTLLRADDGQRLRAMDLVVATDEPVQIDRVYRLISNDTYEDDFLNRVGVLMPRELRIPVRRFSVRVVDEIPMRSAAELLAASVVTERLPGESAFLVVPSMAGVPTVTSLAYTNVPAPITDPTITFDAVAASEDVIAAVGVASVFEVTIGPPEEEVAVQVTIPVSAGALASQVRAEFLLKPRFTIGPSPGPVVVTAGAPVPTRLDCGRVIGSATLVPPDDVTISPIALGDTIVELSAGAAAVAGDRILTVRAGNLAAIRTIRIV